MKQVCQVCNNYCELEEGQAGRCRARRNINGKIVSENYGKITSMALDPIEKIRVIVDAAIYIRVADRVANIMADETA